ncbi:XdhC family protein [Sphaerobacter thermophilus]|uniref:XdhC family protein n=1 Tax=Sphaerobacter thermophilus TaxID=2057 RepID=UPI0039C3CDC9
MSATFQELRDAINQEIPVALATVVAGGQVGAKLLVYEDGRRSGSLGNPELDARVAADALELLPRGQAETRTYTLDDATTADVYIESHRPPRRMIIVGAVHTAIPLERFARELGYHTIVVDAREFFATRERFPDAGELIVGWPDEVLSQLPLGPETDIVLLSHDPKFEDPALEVALRSRAGYIGAMGSKKTSAERNERLRAAGFTEEQIARIHGPIGINIGARTPGEIAVSILAEIIAVRRGRDPRQPGSGLSPAKSDAAPASGESGT